MVVKGPSDGVRAWTAYWMSVGDWIVGAHKRWHEGDPPVKSRHWPRVLGLGAAGAGALMLAERVLS